MNTELITIVERTLPYLVGRIPDSVTQSLAEFMLTGVVDRTAFNIDARNRLRDADREASEDKDHPLHIRFAIWLLYALDHSQPYSLGFQQLLRKFCKDNNIPDAEWNSKTEPCSL